MLEALKYEDVQAEVEFSLQCKGRFAKVYLDQRTAFISGMYKVRTYIMQPPPSGDGTPNFMMPFSNPLKTLFSFTVGCSATKNESYKYTCEHCYNRNECFRRVLLRLFKHAVHENEKMVTIDEMLLKQEYLRMNDYNREALKLVVTIMIDLGRKG